MSVKHALDPVIQQAVALLNAGQAAQAAASLQQLCDERNTNPEHWFLLGAAQAQCGNPAAAEQALRQALEFNPDHSQVLFSLGNVLIRQEKFELAVDPMQRLLSTNPAHRPAKLSLINAFTHMKRFAEAENLCAELAEAEPGATEPMLRLGHIRMMQNRSAEAIVLFDKVLAQAPGSVAALMNKGLALKAAGDFDAALDQFRQVTSLKPDLDTAWFAMGMSWLAKGDTAQAAPCLAQAFEINPRHPSAGDQLANVYRHMRRMDEAAEVYTKMLAAYPDNVRARFYLDAYRARDTAAQPRRIPAEFVKVSYSGKDVGRNFDASLRETLEYRAPAVLNVAVREAFGPRKRGLDIMEIGCGTGLCGSQLADIANTLIGTDLSADMLAVAEEKNAYDKLYVADLIDVLSDNRAAFDLIVAMDVLCYFGNLTDIFRKCHNTLRDEGIFAFSVEKPDTGRPWDLHPYGHFVHSLAHLRTAAYETGFEKIFVKELPLRRELNEERIGYVCLFRRC